MADAPDTDPTADDIRLQVAGAQQSDVGKGGARLSRQTFEQLGIQPGAIIEIEGKRATAAVALPPYTADDGLSIVRLDGLQRRNAGTGLGEHVTVRKAEVKPATRVIVAPAQQGVMLQGNGQALLRTLAGRPVTTGDILSTSVYSQQTVPQGPFGGQRTFGLQEIRLIVTSSRPGGLVQITPETEIEILPEYTEPQEAPIGITYDDVGGLGPVLEQVREMIELPLKHPELFARLGIDPPKGVLLYGPPGTGKTLIARAVASESDASFFTINGPEIMGSRYGESEERLRSIFEDAQKEAPAIVFIDELDSIAPKRSESPGEVERRVVAQLLTLMDGLDARKNVVVIAATNRPDALDEALRRPGRFDREIVVGVPDQQGRREILQIHTRGMPIAQGVDMAEIARLAYGFVGADLGALAREAAIEALRRHLPEIDLEEKTIPSHVLEKLEVTRRDFDQALKSVQPSALREIMIQAPSIGWDDIGGLDEAKESLREGVELPLTNPDAFRQIGIRPAKGFLLYGPPGTGKTLLAKAVAREAEANFIASKSSDLLSKWYGESEQQVSRLFARARQVAPTVLFLDEIDALAPARGGMGSMGGSGVTERVVNTLLAEMDGLEEMQSVVVIAATNRPNLLDPALLRPGRLDELIYVSIPDTPGRRKILDVHTAKMPLASDVDLDALAERTEGYTGADLENLTRKAGLHTIRAGGGEVAMGAFERALDESRASVTPEIERQYKKLASELKQDAASPTKGIGFALPDVSAGDGR
jgi:transitional endoplasmic reticulum ATPase